MAAGVHRPLCGVKLPLATFLSLSMFHTVPFSWCEICAKQISKFPPAAPVVFYYLVFSLSVIKLPFASPTVSPWDYSGKCISYISVYLRKLWGEIQICTHIHL